MNAYICTPWGIIEVKNVSGQAFGSNSTIANVKRDDRNVAFVDTKQFPLVIDDHAPVILPNQAKAVSA